MPIIEIRSLPPKDPAKVPAMLREAAKGGARAFGIPEKQCWALWSEVAPSHYAEGDALAQHPSAESHPPLVLIRALRGRTQEMKAAFLTAVSEAIGKGLGIPATAVWIHFVEMEKAEIWHNGKFYG